MACIKLKKLEEYLTSVDGFDNPKIKLEQYVTPHHIASCMLHTIQTNFGDIQNKMVADLGSGCGILSIGSLLLGAAFTVGFEIDQDAIEVFKSNIDDASTVDCVQSNVITDLVNSKWSGVFDTVIMNPPFGTKRNAGLDMEFLKTSIQLSRKAVYSLHKSSTRDFIHKKALEWNTTPKVVAELRYNIPASYKFHKKPSVDIEVDFWRFEIKQESP